MTHLLFVFLLFLSACSSAHVDEMNAPMNPGLDARNILIVYLSRTGNTKAIAEIIQANVGGRLVALELTQPYPTDYKAIVDQVAKENERGYLPPLKTRIDSIEKYDLIFIGFPTWGMRLPPPMKSFLKQFDLRGKTILPFNTNAGYGIGSSFQTVREICGNSIVLEGFEMKGGVERDGVLLAIKDERRKEAEAKVKQWLREVGIATQ